MPAQAIMIIVGSLDSSLERVRIAGTLFLIKHRRAGRVIRTAFLVN